MPVTRTRLTRLLARFFFASGLCLLTITGLLLAQRYWPNQFPELAPTAQATNNQLTSQQAEFPAPIYLQISALNIALPVIPATKTDGAWDVSSKNISAIAPSSPEHGWILYGHNWPSLLGPLHRARVNNEVVLTFANESQKTYTIDGISKVNPTQDTVLHQVPADHVLLYTCTGFFDRERLIISLIEANK